MSRSSAPVPEYGNQANRNRKPPLFERPTQQGKVFAFKPFEITRQKNVERTKRGRDLEDAEEEEEIEETSPKSVRPALIANIADSVSFDIPVGSWYALRPTGGLPHESLAPFAIQAALGDLLGEYRCR